METNAIVLAAPPVGQRRYRLALCLGLVGTLCFGEHAAAQWEGTPGYARLSVQPRTMATGKQNPAAGEYSLTAVPDYLVSVSPLCTGARRCPLVVFLPGAGYGAREITDWLRPATDKYGMILLAPTIYEPKFIDTALQEVLATYAIDPDKLAVIGRCASGPAGIRFGADNLNVFSRIGAVSNSGDFADSVATTNPAVEFFFDNGLDEGLPEAQLVAPIQRSGHSVRLVLGFRGHEHQVEDYDALGRWLQESWTTPKRSARTAPKVVAASVPELTTEALKQMTTFWTSFQREPDSIRTTARQAHVREVRVPAVPEVSIVMVDMAALAAKYPSVAVDLRDAGLTAERHDAYRIALAATRLGGLITATNPVLAKNAAFMDAHGDEAQALSQTEMWRTP